jgi:uncharacterized protein
MNKGDIKEIILDQYAEKQRILKAKRIIERENLAYWKRFIDSDLIKVTMGVRRAGKSTFTHLLLAGHDYAYINFDDERLTLLGQESLNDVLEALYGHYGDFEYLLIDEVQNIKGWELFVNRLQRNGVKTFVTGSNANLLGRELATHLTGRAVQIEMLPFSFREFLVWRNVDANDATTRGRAKIKRMLEEYSRLGGFPEAVREPDLRKEFHKGLYSSIINKDILVRRKIRYAKTFKELATTLISNFSKMTTYNKLMKVHGMKSVHTAKNYVDYLAEAYLIQIVDKYSQKPKEIANSPKKVYAIDPGIIDTVSVSATQDRGNLMENLVFLQLMRRRAVGPALEIYYWSDYQDHEVDFVLRTGKTVKGLIQVTYASGPDEIASRETVSIVKAGRLLGCKDLKIITWDFEGEIRKDNKRIDCIPLWKWLLDEVH